MREIPKSRMASPLVASIGRVVYRLLGWKCTGHRPAYKKYVILAAPHTSNWDGFLLILAASMLKLNFSFFGKDTLFRGPLGWFMRQTGGIPLDRTRNQSFVTEAVGWFERNEAFAIGVAPEGTRKLTSGWKTGFYHIAWQAKVPVILGYIDYAKKEGGILPEVLIPTGDIDRDFETLRRNYGPLTARYPEWKAPIVPLRSGWGDSPSETEESVQVTIPAKQHLNQERKEEENHFMAQPSIISKTTGLALKALGYVDWVPGLLTRLVVGFAFFDSGRGKLADPEKVVNFFTDLGIPFPELNAAFVSRLEYYGGMLLLVGVATRIVALLLSSTMIVALLTADREMFVGAFTRSTEVGLSDVAPFVLGVFLSWLVVKGAGALSVDALLKRVIQKKEEPA